MGKRRSKRGKNFNVLNLGNIYSGQYCCATCHLKIYWLKSNNQYISYFLCVRNMGKVWWAVLALGIPRVVTAVAVTGGGDWGAGRVGEGRLKQLENGQEAPSFSIPVCRSHRASPFDCSLRANLTFLTQGGLRADRMLAWQLMSSKASVPVIKVEAIAFYPHLGSHIVPRPL